MSVLWCKVEGERQVRQENEREEMTIRTYPKIQGLGKFRDAEKIKIGTVYLEEKVDGSLFRTFVHNNERQYGSKSQSPPDGMFAKAVENMNRILDTCVFPVPIMIYAEYLSKPTMNTLSYDRVPKDNLIVFDVDVNGEYMKPDAKAKFAKDLGLECVPLLAEVDGSQITTDYLKSFFEIKSILGGQNIEGVVVKNYSQFYTVEPYVGNPIFVKYVRDDFMELNKANWRKERSKTYFIDIMAETLKSPARYLKAIQHLKEQGKLANHMRDTPLLIEEVCKDILEEEGVRLKEEVWDHFWRNEIKSRVVKGIPVWYKEFLAKELFGEEQRQS